MEVGSKEPCIGNQGLGLSGIGWNEVVVAVGEIYVISSTRVVSV